MKATPAKKTRATKKAAKAESPAKKSTPAKTRTSRKAPAKSPAKVKTPVKEEPKKAKGKKAAKKGNYFHLMIVLYYRRIVNRIRTLFRVCHMRLGLYLIFDNFQQELLIKIDIFYT